MFKLGIATIALFLIAIVSSFAYYADVDANKQSLSLGVTGQDEYQTFALTNVTPIKKMNGALFAYASRQSKGTDITAQTLNARIEAGIPLNRWELQAYGDVTRDAIRKIDLDIEYGYFAETPTTQISGVNLFAGAGNYSKRRTLDESIGRHAADAQLTFGWLAFIAGKKCDVFGGDLAGVIRFKPEWDFKEFGTEGSISYKQRVSDTVSLGVMFLGIFDSASPLEKKLNTSYNLNLIYVPE
jgi:hypothetical protein